MSKHGRLGGVGVSRRVMRGFTGERLKALRQEVGISQSDLARLADIGRTTLYQWETGMASPQVDVLARVAAALGVAISDLVVVADEEAYLGDLRIRCGLTQPQLGKAAGVSTSMVGYIERGEVTLTDATAEILARVLDVSVPMVRAAHTRARRRPPGSPA